MTGIWRQFQKGKQHDFYGGRQIKQGDMGGAIGRYGYEEQNFWARTVKESNIWKTRHIWHANINKDS